MKFLLFAILNLALSAQAASSPWGHESEAAVVKVSGNSESESYSVKQKTSYKESFNTYTLSGRYLQTKAASIETAKQWDIGLRYERELNETWSAFLQQGAESDTYSGYLQKDNTDVGGKYFFIKEEKTKLFSEFGFRHTKTISSPAHENSTSNSGRLYAEYSGALNESVTAKLWAEYLPNFKESDAYLVNYEPSVSVLMSQVFSLKLAYLVKYHNKTATATEKKEDTTFTTAIVAKF